MNEAKRKFMLAAGVMVVLLVVVLYRFGYTSWSMYSQSQSIKDEITQTQQLISNYADNKGMSQMHTLSQMKQEAILSFIAKRIASQPRLKLNEIQSVHRYTDKSQVNIETFPFETVGGFSEQLVLLDSLQHRFPQSVRSIHFYLDNSTYNEKDQLYTAIFFQRSY